jgi:hypothetical protein
MNSKVRTILFWVLMIVLALVLWKMASTRGQTNRSLGATAPPEKSMTSSQVEDESTVDIKSNPDGAEIYVDGKFVGNAPSKLRIPAGDHLLRASMSGYTDWQKTITITSAGAITVNAVLKRRKQ